MKHTVSRELFAYWNRLRKGRAAPERGDIDPAAIRNVLSDTFIAALEPGSPDFMIRLSGTRLNALFLQELKGRSLVELWQPTDRAPLGRLVAALLDDATPLVAGLKGGPAGHRQIDLEMILLPLRHHGRTHSRLLGAVAPVELPSWLGLLAIDQLSLTTLRVVDPAVPLGDIPMRPSVAQGEDAGRARRYGRFTVHQGGR